MDWYPLLNSLRIAAASTVVVFLAGIWLANLVARAPRGVRAVLDVVLTLPLVLPPTVVGYLLLLMLGPRRPLGLWFMETFSIKLTMVWYAAVFATVVVSFPLMYRTARGAFESFDQTLADATRTLGEYGATSMIAGYTPGSTATVSTTVYQLWRTGDDALALQWVLVNLAISAVVLIAMNMFEARQREGAAPRVRRRSVG